MKNTVKLTVKSKPGDRIRVTEAGVACLKLRGLAREAILCLRSQSEVSEDEKLDLADRIEQAIRTDPVTNLSDVCHEV